MACMSRAESIDMSAGTMELGGTASLRMVWDRKFKWGQDGSENFSVGVQLNPHLGVFLTEGFEMSLEGIVEKGLYESNPLYQVVSGIRWGALLGMRYFFDTDTVISPYLGVALGLTAWNKPNKDTITGLGRFPIGILIALNEHVGVNIGIPVDVTYGIVSRVIRVELPVGYLGVMAFF